VSVELTLVFKIRGKSVGVFEDVPSGLAFVSRLNERYGLSILQYEDRYNYLVQPFGVKVGNCFLWSWHFREIGTSSTGIICEDPIAWAITTRMSKEYWETLTLAEQGSYAYMVSAALEKAVGNNNLPRGGKP